MADPSEWIDVDNRTCKHCGADISHRHGSAKFCNKSHATMWYQQHQTKRCEREGCDQPHRARGLCALHYRQLMQARTGRSHHKMHDRTCEVCGTEWQTPRPDARFCTAKCKGAHLSRVGRKVTKLPADHPVMLLIAEARKPKPKPERVDLRTARECPGCSCWFSPLHHAAATQMLTCSRTCSKRVARRRRRAREHGARGSWTWSEFMAVARKFDYCCAYCGVKPERLDPDHVVPLSRGGSDSPSNLLPACLMCNSSKCAMTLSEWSDWLASRGMPPRRTSWAFGDRRYVHLTDALLASPLAA